MSSNRLQRIVRTRWWVLVLIAIVSVFVASSLVTARNANIPARRATAPITYHRLLGELDDQNLTARLREAEVAARDLNAAELSGGGGPLAPWSEGEIVLDERDKQLVFIGRGDTDAAAIGVATSMRDRFLADRPLDQTSELETRITAAARQLADVDARLSAATTTLPPTDADVAAQARIAELRAAIAALGSRYGTLTVEAIAPVTRTRDEVLAERDTVHDQLLADQIELTTLLETADTAPEPSLDPTQLAVLQAQRDQLQLALNDLILQRIQQEPIGEVDAVETGPSGIAPIPALPTRIVAVLAGILVGLVGLVLVDRARRPLWSLVDVPEPFRLAEVPARRTSSSRDARPWYLATSVGRRKGAVQELRSSIEGLPGFGERLSVGLAALGTGSREVHELAADLAYATAGSGARVLLLDADLDHPTDLVEYRGPRVPLSDALEHPERILAPAVTRAERGSGVASLRFVTDPGRGPDLLSQPGFLVFLDQAREAFDVVIVASPPVGSAAYHVLSQRLDTMVLVAAGGTTSRDEALGALRSLQSRRAEPLGIALLTPRAVPTIHVPGATRPLLDAARPAPRESSFAERLRKVGVVGPDEQDDPGPAGGSTPPQQGKPVVADRELD